MSIRGADQAGLTARGEPVTARNAPAIVKAAGRSAEFAWEEFFQAEIANAHTRKNYLYAVRKFLAWVEGRNLELPRITPGDVGAYLRALELSVPTKKLHLAALRRFFDRLVNRHACVINPAATVKAERYAVVEGKTPEIGVAQARTLLKSIDVWNPVGLRDRAVLAVLVYTAARVGAVAKLTLKSFKHDGAQYTLRFAEKGGKSREIPVRHDLEQFLLEYVEAAQITEGRLFRTANRKTKTLTRNAMTGIDICRMMNADFRGGVTRLIRTQFCRWRGRFSVVFPASAICGASPHKQVPPHFLPPSRRVSPAFILASLSPRPLICGPFPHDELLLPWDQTARPTSQMG